MSNIEIGSLVKSRVNKDFGIVTKLKKIESEDYCLEDFLAEVYWLELSRTRMEFVGDLELMNAQ